METKYDATPDDVMEVARLTRLRLERTVARYHTSKTDDRKLRLVNFWTCLRHAYAFYYDLNPNETIIARIAPDFIFKLLIQIDDEEPRFLLRDDRSQPEIGENNDEDYDLDGVETFCDETEPAHRTAPSVGAVCE